MPEPNGGPPQEPPADQPPPPQPSGDEALERIRRLIVTMLDQFMAKVNQDRVEMERRLADQLTQAIAAIRGQIPLTVAQPQPMAQVESPVVDLPPAPEVTPREVIGAKLADYLADPSKLFDVISQFRRAFAKDDFATAREIAARNPYAIISVAPDPLGGHLPDLLTRVLHQGVQVGTSVRGPVSLPGRGGGPIPLAPSAPGVSPGARFGPSGALSGTTPPATGITSVAQSLERLSDDALETILAHAAAISHRRRVAR